MKNDIYKEVTASILAAMEAGDFKPMVWAQTSGVPHNHATGRKYSGVNSLILWLTKLHNPEYSSAWMTYKQAAAVGAQVRRGEHGHRVVFYKTLTIEDKNVTSANADKTRTVPMLRQFTVFNTTQIDGLPVVDATLTEPQPESVREALCIASAQSLLNQATLIETGDQAFFRPSTDTIYMPEKKRFSGLSDWYATALHELTHWTGHESRLDRIKAIAKASKDDSKEAYAREELVAELGSAFLSASIGFEGLVQGHASYIDSWIKLLKHDDRAIFKAAAMAQKACDFIQKEQTESIQFEEEAAA